MRSPEADELGVHQMASPQDLCVCARERWHELFAEGAGHVHGARVLCLDRPGSPEPLGRKHQE
eukprot:13932939-Alexandrium_andersonii.AAC.1